MRRSEAGAAVDVARALVHREWNGAVGRYQAAESLRFVRTQTLADEPPSARSTERTGFEI
jgi:hypothetical protein